MDDKLLEVGDILYVSQYSSLCRVVIDRVTKKRAFSGSAEFNRN